MPRTSTKPPSRTKRRSRPKVEQLRLDRNLHGGWRPGAGRPRLVPSRIEHRPREEFDARHVIHVTMKLVAGLSSLRRGPEFRRVWSSLVAGCQKDAFRVVHASVQGDHLHLLCEGSDRHVFGRGMNGLATRIAKGLNKFWRRKGRVFRERYHSRVLFSPRAVRNALAYVFGNAEHHGHRLRVGYVDGRSSAPWFNGWANAPVNRIQPVRSPLAAATTWLLRSGWSISGLLTLHEHARSRTAVILA